jgi:hypothetical protein
MLHCQSWQMFDILFSCCLISATTDSLSSPIWILFAKNLIKSAVRRNSFSQIGVKSRPPLDSSVGGRRGVWPSALEAIAVEVPFTFSLSSVATGAFSSAATGFASSVCGSHIGLVTSAPPIIRNSAISAYKTLSCFMARSIGVMVTLLQAKVEYTPPFF